MYYVSEQIFKLCFVVLCVIVKNVYIAFFVRTITI